MKIKYECHKCGKVNEFETEEVKRFVVHLSEADQGSGERDNSTAYIVECQYCHAENKINI